MKEIRLLQDNTCYEIVILNRRVSALCKLSPHLPGSSAHLAAVIHSSLVHHHYLVAVSLVVNTHKESAVA